MLCYIVIYRSGDKKLHDNKTDNGRQHYQYNNFMHSSREAFEYLRKCDVRKKRECRRKGITLITIKYTKDITKEYLINRLKENGVVIN